MLGAQSQELGLAAQVVRPDTGANWVLFQRDRARRRRRRSEVLPGWSQVEATRRVGVDTVVDAGSVGEEAAGRAGLGIGLGVGGRQGHGDHSADGSRNQQCPPLNHFFGQPVLVPGCVKCAVRSTQATVGLWGT